VPGGAGGPAGREGRRGGVLAGIRRRGHPVDGGRAPAGPAARPPAFGPGGGLMPPAGRQPPPRPRPGAVFEALADPTRREVVRRLAQGGPATATELAGDLPVTRQAVAKHLATLAEAGLVTSDRQGRETR